MSSPRGLANQALYHAKILIAAWQRELAREEVSVAVLGCAFVPAISRHLADSYGWFLLDICQLTEFPATPPRCVAQLPPIAAGKALPREVAEFAQLEQQGWLAQLLAQLDGAVIATGGRRSARNLAAAAPGLPSPAELLQWATELEDLFARMSQSRDEY